MAPNFNDFPPPLLLLMPAGAAPGIDPAGPALAGLGSLTVTTLGFWVGACGLGGTKAEDDGSIWAEAFVVWKADLLDI